MTWQPLRNHHSQTRGSPGSLRGSGPRPLDARHRGLAAACGLRRATARVPQLLEAVGASGGGSTCTPPCAGSWRPPPRLAGARYAAIGVLDETGGPDSRTSSRYGVDEAAAEGSGALPDGRKGLLGALIRDPVPLRLAHLSEDARSAGFPPGTRRCTFLGVPIRVQGEIFGNLYLTEKRGGEEFSEEDLHMVRVLATEAGIAIGNARLHEATRQRERWIDGSVAVTTALLAGGRR